MIFENLFFFSHIVSKEEAQAEKVSDLKDDETLRLDNQGSELDSK